jgi:hypothetical protein
MIMNIDRRKAYYLMVDTETANSSTDGKVDRTNALCYDIGFAIIDKKGNIYESYSFVIDEVFYGMADIMTSAYYSNKIPQYLEDIAQGKRIVANTYQIRATMLADFAEFDCVAVCAHNSRFDYGSLNNAQRWNTKSKYRYWMPYGVEWWDTMKMATDVVAKMPTYQRFCESHGLLTAKGKCKVTAEALYRFISHDAEFDEAHTALEDVEIEAQILAYCYRQHKKMRKELFAKKLEEI